MRIRITRPFAPTCTKKASDSTVPSQSSSRPSLSHLRVARTSRSTAGASPAPAISRTTRSSVPRASVNPITRITASCTIRSPSSGGRSVWCSTRAPATSAPLFVSTSRVSPVISRRDSSPACAPFHRKSRGSDRGQSSRSAPRAATQRAGPIPRTTARSQGPVPTGASQRKPATCTGREVRKTRPTLRDMTRAMPAWRTIMAADPQTRSRGGRRRHPGTRRHSKSRVPAPMATQSASEAATKAPRRGQRGGFELRR
mmetsp:Transcript_29227/g.67076  ORF Transcript_29227/g.67076 Transcript_29227/m.67076 type:complete len:256 (-) Transcript_29227:720-1487(-)